MFDPVGSSVIADDLWILSKCSNPNLLPTPSPCAPFPWGFLLPQNQSMMISNIFLSITKINAPNVHGRSTMKINIRSPPPREHPCIWDSIQGNRRQQVGWRETKSTIGQSGWDEEKYYIFGGNKPQKSPSVLWSWNIDVSSTFIKLLHWFWKTGLLQNHKESTGVFFTWRWAKSTVFD